VVRHAPLRCSRRGGGGRNGGAGSSDKPRGAPGRFGRQRPDRQRTRRWSKASGFQPAFPHDASVAVGSRRKDEGARCAVNATAGDGRGGDAHQGQETPSPVPTLSAVGKLRRAVGASRGIPFRDGRKRGEPQDRQRPATWPQGRGGGNRRGGAKPRGRNADGNRHSHPEGKARRSGHAPDRPPGVDSTASYDEGEIFGQPQERKPGEQPGRKDRDASVTAPSSGGSRTTTHSCSCADRSVVLEGQRVAKASREGQGGRR
jgi:hypothetical protein